MMKLRRNKKQKWIFGVLFCGYMVVLAGCGDEKNQTDEISNQYVEENIVIAYDLDQIEDREEAWRCRVEYYDADEELLIQRLFHGEVTEEETSAVGKTLRSGSGVGRDSLTLYRGGQYDEDTEELFGGFYYSRYLSEEKEYQDIVATTADHPDEIEQILGDNARGDYSTEQELAFMGREDLRAYVEDLVEKCGLPDMEIRTIYSLDYETMQAHREISTDRSEDIDTSVCWEKEDEAYLIQLNEVVDGIPVMDHDWEPDVVRNYEPTEVPVKMIVSDSGVIDFSIVHAVMVQEQTEKCTLLSAEDAQKLVLSSLKKAGSLMNWTVEAMELKYIVLHDGDDLVLEPAWVFCVSKDSSTEALDSDEKVAIKNYNHYVFDAVTGEQIDSASK